MIDRVAVLSAELEMVRVSLSSVVLASRRIGMRDINMWWGYIWCLLAFCFFFPWSFMILVDINKLFLRLTMHFLLFSLENTVWIDI